MRIEGGSGPPLTPQVWLQGDPGAWRPQRAGLVPVWEAWRVAVLAAAWQLRCRREAWGVQFTPAELAAAAVEDLRRIVVADWLRASTDLTRAMEGVSPTWFPRQPSSAARFGVVEFETKWCEGSVVAYVRHCQGRRPVLEFRLSSPSVLGG